MESELDGNGFADQNDFDQVAWQLIEQWTESNKVSDGLPRSEPEQREINGKMRSCGHPVAFDDYIAFGQLVGEVIIAVQPKNYAAKQHASSFVDTAFKFGPESGNAFKFSPLPMNGNWDTVGEYNKHHYVSKGAHYDIRYGKHDRKKCTQMFFTAPELGISETELEPWQGTTKYGGDMKGIMKHWQLIAYRFA